MSVNQVYLGIDPGVSGALAAFKVSGETSQFFEVIHVEDMPVEVTSTKRKRVSPHGVNLWIEHVIEMTAPCAIHLTVEAVHARPNDSTSGAFTFGDSFGVLRGVLACKLFPYCFVSPMKWKRKFNLIGTDKDYSRTVASQYFDSESFKRKKDHNRADALLIGLYGMNNLFK